MIIVTYAMLKYRLMDINIALTRAGIFIFVYTLVLGIPFWLGYATKAWFPATALAVLFATAGPFIYQYLRKKAEDIILKEQKQYQKALLEISSTMLLIKELDRLLKTIVLKVVDLVKVEWAAVYLKDEKLNAYVLKHEKARQGTIGLPGEVSPEAGLITHLQHSRLPLIGEEIGPSAIKAGLAIPCFIDNSMLGFLLLGDKPKGTLFTQDDVGVFTILSNQTALAIENCQFYSQERQQEHFRRIATLDHQIDCMAHEIDNPIQGVVGMIFNLEEAIDDLKSNLPPDRYEHLKNKLSRGKLNAQRITKMIGAVKEFSKPTTGELSPITLQSIMDDFNNIMQPQFKHQGVTFIQELPQETVWLRANKVEIEQVLVNLATNSIQAINEIWANSAATPESKKQIILKAYNADRKILKIDFSDTGSGIKKNLIEDIFLDFVTTKASSVGTGLGLSITRKILHRHQGRIWAESEGENKGAAFHMELPIPGDITQEEIAKAEKEQQEKNKRILF